MEYDRHAGLWTSLQLMDCWQHRHTKVPCGTQAYANSKKVKIVGDMPIYVGGQSADVWAHQELFELTPSGAPANVAGVPPDAFSETGQLWGNPLYDWPVCLITLRALEASC